MRAWASWTNGRPGSAPLALASATVTLGATGGIALAWSAARGQSAWGGAVGLAILLPLALLIGWSNATSP